MRVWLLETILEVVEGSGTAPEKRAFDLSVSFGVFRRFRRVEFDRDACAFGEYAYRFGKFDPFHKLYEAEHVSFFAAAETAEKLFRRSDVERRCFFVMKRAESEEVASRAFQMDVVAADDLREFVGGAYAVDEFRREKGHFSISLGSKKSRPRASAHESVWQSLV